MIGFARGEVSTFNKTNINFAVLLKQPANSSHSRSHVCSFACQRFGKSAIVELKLVQLSQTERQMNNRITDIIQTIWLAIRYFPKQIEQYSVLFILKKEIEET